MKRHKKGNSKRIGHIITDIISHPIKLLLFIDSFDSSNCRIKEPDTVLFLSYSNRSVLSDNVSHNLQKVKLSETLINIIFKPKAHVNTVVFRSNILNKLHINR